METKFLKVIIGLAAFFIFAVFTVNAYPQNADKYVVIVRADECSMCKSNEDRWTDDIISRYKNSDIIFLTYDLTSQDTRKESRELLNKNNLSNVIQEDTVNPGGIYVVDAKSGTVISRFNMDESTDSVLQTLGSGSPLK